MGVERVFKCTYNLVKKEINKTQIFLHLLLTQQESPLEVTTALTHPHAKLG